MQIKVKIRFPVPLSISNSQPDERAAGRIDAKTNSKRRPRLASRKLTRSYRSMPQKTKRPPREIETAVKTIIPCLWFDRQAEEAANFYISLFPDSHVDEVAEAPWDFPRGTRGDVLSVDFTLMGRKFSGLNGGPYFKFNEAVSFTVPCESQAEVDRYWKALSAVSAGEQ